MSDTKMSESWRPVVMDAGLPLIEQGSRLSLELSNPDVGAEEIETKLIFLADQNRPDRLTWLLDNAKKSVVEPRKIRFPNGETYYGFLLGGPVELVPINIDGMTIDEPECLRVFPKMVIERIVAEKAGRMAIYFASSFDEQYQAYDLGVRHMIAADHLYENPGHSQEN